VLVIDTGPLVATADRADKDHAACRALLEGDTGPLVTTALVIAEAAYLIDRQLGPQAEAALYASITGGQLEVASLDREDWVRIGELVTTYADLRLGGTDASVITLAERLGTTRIATLNHRHFTVVRPRHASAFELLP
jgi:predicted nucleic acid-binding protein